MVVEMSVTAGTKFCKGCNQPKSLGDFYGKKSCKDGLMVRCKKCYSEYRRNWAGNGKTKDRKIDLAVNAKVCTKCKVEKSLDGFSSTRNGKKESQCRECKAQATRAYYQLRKEHVKRYAQLHKDQIYKNDRKRKLRKNYSLTHDEYMAIFDDQDGKCAICGQEETARDKTGKIRVLSVDHDHETGEVRGLLCKRCNVGLGYFRDNPQFLSSAACYVVRFSEQSTLAAS